MIFFGAALLTFAGINRSTGGSLGDGRMLGYALFVTAALTAAFCLIALVPLSRRAKRPTAFWTVQKLSTLFFIPMIWWVPVCVVLGLLAILGVK